MVWVRRLESGHVWRSSLGQCLTDRRNLDRRKVSVTRECLRVRLDIPEWDDAVGGTGRWDGLEVVAPTAADVVEEQRWKVEAGEVAGVAKVVVAAVVGEGVDEGVEGVEVVVVAAVVDHWYLASKQPEVRDLGTCQNKYRRGWSD